MTLEMTFPDLIPVLRALSGTGHGPAPGVSSHVMLLEHHDADQARHRPSLPAYLMAWWARDALPIPGMASCTMRPSGISRCCANSCAHERHGSAPGQLKPGR